MSLPPRYAFLNDEPGPRILKEALAEYGVLEIPGEESNERITGWAQEIGGWMARFYREDSIPWCGLFVAICAKRAGFPHDQTALGARNWLNWGQASRVPALGDVLVFGRAGGGHVGFYVGEDSGHYHVLGGNQSDRVNITRIAKSRFLGARRCQWKVSEPQNIRPIIIRGGGDVSENEA